MSDDRSYARKQDGALAEFEALCLRCGRCCGLGQDPCANLIKGDDGKYLCRTYSERLGSQKTVSGNVFACVPIQEVIRKGSPNPLCGYAPSRMM